MARTRDLKIQILGDADKLDREVKRSNKSLDGLGKQTRLTASMSSKGFSAMRVGATGAAAAFGGLALAGKEVVEAAIESEAAMAKVRKMVINAGFSWEKHSKQIDEVIQKHSQLTGLDDEELAESFANMVRTTGNLNEAFKLNALAADIARTKGTDLAGAQSLLARVYNGSFMGLKRLGIAFEPVTAAQDKLKASTDKASASQLDAAKKADFRASREKAIAALQKSFGGQAEAYGRTTAGSVDRASVAFENLKETIGMALAPTVRNAAQGFAKFVNEMQDGTGQGGRFADKLREIWESIRPIITGFGRAARAAGQFAAEHPGVLRLVASVAAVGTAIKALRFVSAATGFSALVSAGRAAARLLKRRLVVNAAEAGAEAATASAAGFAGGTGKFGRAGRASGKAFGRGLAIGAVIAIPAIIYEIENKLADALEKVNWGRLIRSLPGKILGGIRSFFSGNRSNVPGRQAGGLIPGSGRGDIIPAMLEPGEFVVRRQVVEKYGPTFFADLNGTMGQGQPQDRRYSSGGIVARANRMDAMQLPYVWGGGHGGGIKGGVDCSGAVSWLLGVSPRVSGAFQSFGLPGPGSYNDTKIYANPSHVFAVVNGRGWGTSRENARGGPGWLSYNHRPGFAIRHLEDSGRGGSGGSKEGDTQESPESRKQRITEREERAGSRLVNRIMAPFAKGFSMTSRRATALGTAIEDAGTAYGQAERVAGFTEEDLGTPQGRAQRLNELGNLAEMKRKTINRMKRRADALKRAIANRESLLRKLRKAREKSKGAKRAKINERIKPVIDRLDDLKAELKTLGVAITDTELDVGDLMKEARDVAVTPDTEIPTEETTAGKLATALGDVDLRERAGLISPEVAAAQREQLRNIALALPGLSERERWQIMGDLREAQQAAAEAVTQNTQALTELRKSIDAQNAIASSVMAVSLREAWVALADTISGQIVGQGVNQRALTAGTGTLARY